MEAELPGRSRRAGSACSGRSRTRGGPTQRPRKRSAGISSRRTTRPHRGHDEECPKLLRMERRRERGMLASGPEEGKVMGSESGQPNERGSQRGSGPARRGVEGAAAQQGGNAAAGHRSPEAEGSGPRGRVWRRLTQTRAEAVAAHHRVGRQESTPVWQRWENAYEGREHSDQATSKMPSKRYR